MKKNKDDNYCAVIVFWGNNTNSYVKFKQYPEEINDSISATWSTVTIPGRSGPVAAYSSTEAQKVSFSLTLHREMESYSAQGEPEYTIDDLILLLRRAVYPEYTGTSGLHPPITTFKFGEFYAKGYVESVSYQWKKPIINKKYQVCEVSVSMTGVPGKIWSAKEFANKSPDNPYRALLNI